MSQITQPQFETQQQRWLKYGANVVLSIVVVILLAAACVYFAQRFDKRVDTTQAGLYSLKPQTVEILKGLKEKVKLVSLYQAKDQTGKENPYVGPIRDLLEEYARKSGGMVDYDVIDPVTQPAKTDALVSEVIAKYGGATKACGDFVSDYSKTSDQLKTLTGKQAADLAGVNIDSLGDDERGQTLAAIVQTVRDQIPSKVASLQQRTERSTKAKFPDYKSITDRIKDGLDAIAQSEAAIVKLAAQYKTDQKLPEGLKNYLATAGADSDAVAKLCAETSKKVDSLGELKVGDLQQAIKTQDIVLVLGTSEWKTIDNTQIWTTDARDLKNFSEGQSLKPRFAGEQAITTAILSVSSPTKQKIAIVRPGGGPLATPGMPPFSQGGPLSGIADRLRAYNFDVVEKDLSGQYAMQAQMQGQQAEPEPSDTEIKDAIWIVLDLPSQQQQQMPGADTQFANKVAEHMKSGGSALVLGLKQADTLSAALKDYGIEMETGTVIVHSVPKTERASGDVSDEIQKLPYVFVSHDYGTHPLTAPLQSLDTVLAVPVPIKVTKFPGVDAVSIMPVPVQGQTWGETNPQAMSSPDQLKFDPAVDAAGPFYAGAAASKGASRVVVFGMLQSFTNDVLSWPDADMMKRGVVVARFPGNSELFTNSIFWLAKMEPMIAISPAAMQVSRIAPMSDAALATWRVGVLLILLPGLVLAAGVMMYFERRD